MCQAGQCAVYEELIAQTFRRRKASVVALFMLLITGAVMGLALLLSTLLLPDLSATSTTESIRTASGLLVSAVSVVSVKEVLDRWSSLATFEVVLTGLRSCHSLPQVQLDAYWAFAQELTKKV